MMPIRKPSTLPRVMGPIDRSISSREGINCRSVGRCTGGGVACPAVSRISDNPNMPTATGTMPMPSLNSMIP